MWFITICLVIVFYIILKIIQYYMNIGHSHNNSYKIEYKEFQENLIYEIKDYKTPIQIFFEFEGFVDIDITALCLGENNKIINDADFVYYNSKERGNIHTLKVIPYDCNKFQNQLKWKEVTSPVDRHQLVWVNNTDDCAVEDQNEFIDYCILTPKNWPKSIKKILICLSVYQGQCAPSLDYAHNIHVFGSLFDYTVHTPHNLKKLFDYNLDDIIHSNKESDVNAIAILCIEKDINNSVIIKTYRDSFTTGLEGLIDKYA